MDMIHVRGLHFHVGHGVYDEERRDGRHFDVDIDCWLQSAGAGQSDALDDTLDYRALAQVVCDVMEGPSRQLVEWLGEEMCRRTFALTPRVARVRVQIRKKASGVPGEPAWVGVTIDRVATHNGEGQE